MTDWLLNKGGLFNTGYIYQRVDQENTCWQGFVNAILGVYFQGLYPFSNKKFKYFSRTFKDTFPFFKDSLQCKKVPWVYVFFSSSTTWVILFESLSVFAPSSLEFTVFLYGVIHHFFILEVTVVGNKKDYTYLELFAALTFPVGGFPPKNLFAPAALNITNQSKVF